MHLPRSSEVSAFGSSQCLPHKPLRLLVREALVARQPSAARFCWHAGLQLIDRSLHVHLPRSNEVSAFGSSQCLPHNQLRLLVREALVVRQPSAARSCWHAGLQLIDRII